MSLADETAANYRTFFAAWTAQASANWNRLHANPSYLLSYRRIAALQALKHDLISPNMPAESSAFFQEAHNDALVSHVSASYGAWRSALKSLRSVIENALAALYYSDHPIELKNWLRGRRRTTFSELMKYFESHPSLDCFPESVTGLERIKSEYATLSKAVHASAVHFRMTDDVSQVLLWSTTSAKIGQWSSREKEVVAGVSQLIVAMFHEKLNGAQRPQLREALGYVFSSNVRASLKDKLGVRIPAP